MPFTNTIKHSHDSFLIFAVHWWADMWSRASEGVEPASVLTITWQLPALSNSVPMENVESSF